MLAEERSKRVRYVREEALRFTKEQFSKVSGIPLSTLQNWENIRNNGLTERGVNRLVQALRAEGIDCAPEWLLYGIGEKPVSPFIQQKASANNVVKSVGEDVITQELQLFHQLNPDAVDIVVNDDAMLPYLWPGDHVAGKKYRAEEIKMVIGLPCIVQTTDGLNFVRLLEIGVKPDAYNLVCANPHTRLKGVMENIQVSSVAPIEWIRRRIVNQKHKVITKQYEKA